MNKGWTFSKETHEGFGKGDPKRNDAPDLTKRKAPGALLIAGEECQAPFLKASRGKALFLSFLLGIFLMTALALTSCSDPAGSEGDGFVAVTSISGVTATVYWDKGAQPLHGTVLPSNATNKTIAWSISNGGATGASISGNSLTATAEGTVVVTATIANGLTETTPYTQNFNIAVDTSDDTYKDTGIVFPKVTATMTQQEVYNAHVQARNALISQAQTIKNTYSSYMASEPDYTSGFVIGSTVTNAESSFINAANISNVNTGVAMQHMSSFLSDIETSGKTQIKNINGSAAASMFERKLNIYKDLQHLQQRTDWIGSGKTTFENALAQKITDIGGLSGTNLQKMATLKTDLTTMLSGLGLPNGGVDVFLTQIGEDYPQYEAMVDNILALGKSISLNSPAQTQAVQNANTVTMER